MGPAEAMRAAEHLYLSGYVSYPRTETTTYPSTFSPRQTLGLLVRWPRTVVAGGVPGSFCTTGTRGSVLQASHASYGAFVAELLGGAMVPARRGTDTGDHPPITPMRGGGAYCTGHAAHAHAQLHWQHSARTDCHVASRAATVSAGGLSGSTAALYNMIVRHFIATVSPDCEYITTKV